MSDDLLARHPENDLRSLLERRPGAARGYTVRRIRESYAEAADILSHCPGVGADAAFDVGCGSGFHSFALATHFDRVIAVDTLRSAIREARRLARRAGVTAIAFKRARAESFHPPVRVDFVRCNGVSHAASSRIRVLSRSRESLKDPGWLFYGELCEGYGAMELSRAVAAQDEPELTLRLRQILNGFLGRSGYRFFLSESVHDLAERLGLVVTRTETGRWHGLPYYQQVWCRTTTSEAPRSSASWHDHDYVAPDKDALAVRVLLRDAIATQGGVHRDRRRSTQIERFAAEDENRFAPFALFALVADLAPWAMSPKPPVVERPLRLAGRRKVPWEALAAHTQHFAELVTTRTAQMGLSMESHDSRYVPPCEST